MWDNVTECGDHLSHDRPCLDCGHARTPSCRARMSARAGRRSYPAWWASPAEHIPVAAANPVARGA